MEVRERLPEGSRSYEAVRNYHSDREAPVDYYVEVARFLSVSLSWLLTGHGEMDLGSRAMEEGLEGILTEDPAGEMMVKAVMGISAFPYLPRDLQSVFGWSFLKFISAVRLEVESARQEDIDALAAGLWNLGVLLWAELNGGEPDPEDTRFTLFSLSVQTALRAAIPVEYGSEEACRAVLGRVARWASLPEELTMEGNGDA